MKKKHIIFLTTLKYIMSKDVVKMKQGMSYTSKEKTIILNVFKYFCQTYPDKCVTEIVRYTSKATGCSEKSIFRFRKEEASPEGFKEPCKTKTRKNININSRFLKYDESVRDSIKFIIHNLKCRNIVPSLSTILKNIHSDEKLPNFSLMTLKRLLYDMGFTYVKEKSSNKSVLVEQSENKDLEDKKPNVKNEVTASNIPTFQSNKFVSTNQNLPLINNHTSKPNHQPMMPNAVENIPHSQMYLTSQNHMQIPLHPKQEPSVIDPIQVGFQHSMLLNHRISHSVHPMHHHHNIGFMHHPHGFPQSHNQVMQ